MQRSIICPHCHTGSNHGVRVCVGCQAEVHYGASKEAVMFVFVAAIICGALADDADVAALSARSAELLERRPLYPGLPAFPSFAD